MHTGLFIYFNWEYQLKKQHKRELYNLLNEKSPPVRWLKIAVLSPTAVGEHIRHNSKYQLRPLPSHSCQQKLFTPKQFTELLNFGRKQCCSHASMEIHADTVISLKEISLFSFGVYQILS